MCCDHIDEARRTREQRNLQQRIRRAEMTDEQREEMRRKQREYQRQYRERKKAESQNNSASCVLTAPGIIFLCLVYYYSGS